MHVMQIQPKKLYIYFLNVIVKLKITEEYNTNEKAEEYLKIIIFI